VNAGNEKLIVGSVRQLWHGRALLKGRGGRVGGHRRYGLSPCPPWEILTFPRARMPGWKFAWAVLSYPRPSCHGGDSAGVCILNWLTGFFSVTVSSVQAADSGQKRRSSLRTDPAPPNLPLHHSFHPFLALTSLFIAFHLYNSSHLCDAGLETCNLQEVKLNMIPSNAAHST